MRERIVIDGAAVDEDRFVAVHERLRSVLSDVETRHGTLSFFEMLTAMAFQAFAEATVDAVVLEVGMGGTWDATNVADGLVSVVTPISLDHTEYLGPDEAAIARERAGEGGHHQARLRCRDRRPAAGRAGGAPGSRHRGRGHGG